MNNQQRIEDMKRAFQQPVGTEPFAGPFTFTPMIGQVDAVTVGKSLELHEVVSTILGPIKTYICEMLREPEWDVPEAMQLQASLAFEEFVEFITSYLSGDAVNTLREIADVEVTVKGAAALHGWDAETAFQRVMDSQFSKLVDGNPVKNKSGKTIKGPDYKAADLTDLIKS